MSDLFGPQDGEAMDHFRGAETAREQGLPKRFYTEVDVREVDGRFEVRLDDRPVRTPGRSLLAFPRPSLAESVAGEWKSQVERIDPQTMPATRLANTAIDGVADAVSAVQDDVVKYAGSDLLCYRALEPAGLVERESTAWDPMIAWAAESLSARFTLGAGIVPVEQPAEALEAFRRAVLTIDDPFRLAGLHVMTALSGSAILSLAVARGQCEVEDAWAAAHVEEDWNVHMWGPDDEASARRAGREIEMRTAALFATS